MFYITYLVLQLCQRKIVAKLVIKYLMFNTLRLSMFFERVNSCFAHKQYWLLINANCL